MSEQGPQLHWVVITVVFLYRNVKGVIISSRQTKSQQGLTFIIQLSSTVLSCVNILLLVIPRAWSPRSIDWRLHSSGLLQVYQGLMSSVKVEQECVQLWSDGGMTKSKLSIIHVLLSHSLIFDECLLCSWALCRLVHYQRSGETLGVWRI